MAINEINSKTLKRKYEKSLCFLAHFSQSKKNYF